MKHNNIKLVNKTEKEKCNVYKFEYEDGTEKVLDVYFKDSSKKEVVHTLVHCGGKEFLSFDFENNQCISKHYSVKSGVSNNDLRETVYYLKDGTKAIMHESGIYSSKKRVFSVDYYNKDDILTKTKVQTEVVIFNKKYINKTIVDYKDGTVKTDKITEDFEEWNKMVNLICRILNDNEKVKEAFLKLDYRSANIFLDVLRQYIPFWEMKNKYEAKNSLLFSTGYNTYELKELFLEVLKKVKPDYKSDKFGNRYFPNNLSETVSLYEKGIIGKPQYYASLIEKEYGIDKIEEFAKSNSLKDIIKSEYENLSEEDTTDVYNKLLECILVNRKKNDDAYIRGIESGIKDLIQSEFDRETIKKVCGIEKFVWER